MRKKIALLCAIMIAFSVAGCSNSSSKNNTSGGSSQTNVEGLTPAQLAEEFTLKAVEHDFSPMHKVFTASLAGQLDMSQLNNSWNAFVAPYGEFSGNISTTTEISEDYTTVVCSLEYDTAFVEFWYLFNNNNEIDGLQFELSEKAPEPEVTDKYTETSLRVGELELYGMLTMPNDVENPPVVVLVPGSGKMDMNQTYGEAGNQSFKDIAHGLAEQGIATIRFNKRTYQYPEKTDNYSSIVNEYVSDVTAAIELARGNSQLDTKHIYLFGHSLGAMVAPAIALENSDITGLILFAGTPRGYEDIVYDQNIAGLKNSNLTDEELEKNIAAIDAGLEKIKGYDQTSDKTTWGFKSSYWYSLTQLKSKQALVDLEIPMLIMHGADDFQLSTEKDFEAFKELLADKNNCTYKLYEGINHFFMKSSDAKSIADYDVAGTVDVQIIDDVSHWITEN